MKYSLFASLLILVLVNFIKMSVIFPAIDYVFLGDTYNLANYAKMSGKVYNFTQITNNTKFVEDRKFVHAFKLIETPTDVPRFLGIDSRLSLAIKTRGHSSNLPDNYRSIIVSSVRSLKDTVQVLIKIEYRLLKEYAGDNVAYDERWKTMDPERVGTHYVHSLIRGSNLLASIVFWVANDEQKNKVKNAIRKYLGTSGNLPHDFKARLRNITEESETYYRIETFSCTSCFNFFSGFPNIDNVDKYRNEFFIHFNQTGNEKGYAIDMELVPLSNLSTNYPEYSENSEVISILGDIDEKYNDIKITKKEFNVWYDSIFLHVSNEEDKPLRAFKKDIFHVEIILIKALIDLDIGPNSSIQQFDAFYESYGSRERSDYFAERLKLLKQRTKVYL